MSFNCDEPLCNAILKEKGYCEKHLHNAGKKLTTAKLYDRFKRDARSKQFYNSPEWKVARQIKLTANPICEHCQASFATIVHHRRPLAEVRDTQPDLCTAQENLMSVCAACHRELEVQAMKSQGVRRVSSA